MIRAICLAIALTLGAAPQTPRAQALDSPDVKPQPGKCLKGYEALCAELDLPATSGNIKSQAGNGYLSQRRMPKLEDNEDFHITTHGSTILQRAVPGLNQ